MRGVHQEHGELDCADASVLRQLRPGDRLRVLPIHACMTAAAYPAYHVLEWGDVVARWERVNGW